MNHNEFMVMLSNQLDELLQTYPELRTVERAFIAWTLVHLPDQDISEKEAVAAVVDGDQEKGLDAIYTPPNGGKMVVLSTVYHKDPNGKGVKKNELVKLFTGLDWLLDGDLSKITRNPNFKARAEEFRAAYYSFEYSGVDVIYAATVLNGPRTEENDEIDRASRKLRDRGMPFRIDTLTVGQLTDLLITTIHRRFNINIDLRFAGKFLTYERAGIGARAIVGPVRGTDLAEIYRQHGFQIFDINIRNYLGNVKINEAIKDTACDNRDAGNFWFYNNGITFVCDEYSFRSLEDTVVRLENAQIINGCQTVTSLANAGNKLDSHVEVLVRVIEKKNDIDFVRRVTQFANSQNAVRPADLVGTDTIQLELKRLLLDLGYYYETRRGDYKAEKASLTKPVIDVFPLKQVAQACASVFNQKPGIAKKDTSKLFITQADGGYYDQVFPATIMPRQIIAAVALLDNMPRLRASLEEKSTAQNQEIPPWLPHSDFFLVGLFYLKTFDQTKVRDETYLTKYKEWIDNIADPELIRLYQELVGEVDAVVKANESTYGYSHPTFFKTQPEYDKKLRPAVASRIKHF